MYSFCWKPAAPTEDETFKNLTKCPLFTFRIPRPALSPSLLFFLFLFLFSSVSLNQQQKNYEKAENQKKKKHQKEKEK
jgi:hypothetical protein